MVLINKPLQKLIVYKDHLILLLKSFHIVFGYFGSGPHCQSFLVLEAEVGVVDHYFYDIADELLAGPDLSWLLDCRLQQEHTHVFGEVSEERRSGLEQNLAII